MTTLGWRDVTRQNKASHTLLSAQAPLSSQKSERLLPTACRCVRTHRWLKPPGCTHTFNQQNYQLTTSVTTRGTTTATDVIFSLATAMTHFLPLQSYFLGLFPDGLIGSLLIPPWVVQALICWERGSYLNSWLSCLTVVTLLKTPVEWLACLLITTGGFAWPEPDTLSFSLLGQDLTNCITKSRSSQTIYILLISGIHKPLMGQPIN